MILVDFSNIAWQVIHGAKYQLKGQPFDDVYFRHAILESLRWLNIKNRREYGEMTICCDGKNYWRKDIHPHYKASRKKARDKLDFDIEEVMGWIDGIKQDIKNNFPFRLVEVNKAEADDVIGLLAHRFSINEKVLVVSDDQDMLQLQRFKNVYQYAPRKREMLSIDNAQKFLKEKFIRGDVGDGVPGVQNDLDTLVTEGKRQKAVRKKDLALWLDMSHDEIVAELGVTKERWDLNVELMDLTKTPKSIKIAIIKEYDNQVPQNKVLEYFIEKRMDLFIEHVNDF